MTCDEIEELAGALALGAALPEEVEAAQRHLATCPIGHPAVRELAATAALLADAVPPVEPPARLRGRVLAAVRAESAASAGAPPLPLRAAGEAAPHPSLPPSPTPLRADAMREGRGGARPRALPVWLAAAAGLVLAVGLSAWNVNLRRELDSREDRITAQQRALDAVARGGQVVAFAAAPNAGGARGAVVRPAEGQPVVLLENLPRPADNKLYQLWAIRDGHPEDLGVFLPGDDGRYTTMLPDLAGIEAVAITVEPRRVPQPTTAPVLTAPLTARGA